MSETAQEAAEETEEQRNARRDAEYERNRAQLSPKSREWLDSVVGSIDIGFEIEASEYTEETRKQLGE